MLCIQSGFNKQRYFTRMSTKRAWPHLSKPKLHHQMWSLLRPKKPIPPPPRAVGKEKGREFRQQHQALTNAIPLTLTPT
jgi:hypothetical protein